MRGGEVANLQVKDLVHVIVYLLHHTCEESQIGSISSDDFRAITLKFAAYLLILQISCIMFAKGHLKKQSCYLM